jgi:hypothetical protein
VTGTAWAEAATSVTAAHNSKARAERMRIVQIPFPSVAG